MDGVPMHTNAPVTDAAASIIDRTRLIGELTARVEALQAEGLTERAAIRTTAAETGMHPMRVKRLAVLFPEA